MKRLRLKKKQSYLLFIFIALIVLVFDISFLVKTNSSSGFNNISTIGAPSSKKPTVAAVASYSVPPANPKYITISAINVNARVDEIYLNANNQIEAPSNIYDSAWYNSSSLPGQKGAMFIDGHVSSWTADGVFYNLKKLVAGEHIVITRGDNTKYTYVVNAVKIYPYNNVDMTQVLAPYTPNTAGLNLMTCTGQVIKNTSNFNERLVVYSTLEA